VIESNSTKKLIALEYHGEKSWVPVSVVVMLASPILGMLFAMARVIAFHVWVMVLSPSDLSRTTNGDVAFCVQTIGLLAELMVQVLRALPSSEPKKRAPDGVVKGETVEVKSEAMTSPKTATSRTGRVSRDWKRSDEETGGVAVEVAAERTNCTSAVAILRLGIDVRYWRMTWSKRPRVPKRRGSN